MGCVANGTGALGGLMPWLDALVSYRNEPSQMEKKTYLSHIGLSDGGCHRRSHGHFQRLFVLGLSPFDIIGLISLARLSSRHSGRLLLVIRIKDSLDWRFGWIWRWVIERPREFLSKRSRGWLRVCLTWSSFHFLHDWRSQLTALAHDRES